MLRRLDDIFIRDDSPYEGEVDVVKGGIFGQDGINLKPLETKPLLPDSWVTGVRQGTITIPEPPAFVLPYYETRLEYDLVGRPLVNLMTCSTCGATVNVQKTTEHTNWHRKEHEKFTEALKPRYIIGTDVATVRSDHGFGSAVDVNFPKQTVPTASASYANICVCGHSQGWHRIQIGQQNYDECQNCECKVYVFSHTSS